MVSLGVFCSLVTSTVKGSKKDMSSCISVQGPLEPNVTNMTTDMGLGPGL